MNDESRDQMSAETKEFLGELTRDDIAALKRGMPILKAVIGFGSVMKWLIIAVGSILAGVIFLGESVTKILGWLWPPPHP